MLFVSVTLNSARASHRISLFVAGRCKFSAIHRDVVDVEGFDRLSMACPALPLCGLAISEAERGLPDVNRRLRALLDSLGFDATDQFVVRMTGASLPNPRGVSLSQKLILLFKAGCTLASDCSASQVSAVCCESSSVCHYSYQRSTDGFQNT